MLGLRLLAVLLPLGSRPGAAAGVASLLLVLLRLPVLPWYCPAAAACCLLAAMSSLRSCRGATCWPWLLLQPLLPLALEWQQGPSMCLLTFLTAAGPLLLHCTLPPLFEVILSEAVAGPAQPLLAGGRVAVPARTFAAARAGRAALQALPLCPFRSSSLQSRHSGAAL